LTRRRAEDGNGDQPEDGNAEAERVRRGPAREVVLSASSQAWFRRFEISGSWPFVSAAEVEERFEQLVRRRWISPRGPSAGSRPREAGPPVDVFVADGDIWVEVDLPGVTPETVRARLEDGDLVVEAERLAAAPARGARATSVERPQGRLYRRIPLPRLAGPARLEHDFEGGVLRVRIRLKAERP
jgi:HSP20 family molecular chaperone IbpA